MGCTYHALHFWKRGEETGREGREGREGKGRTGRGGEGGEGEKGREGRGGCLCFCKIVVFVQNGFKLFTSPQDYCDKVLSKIVEFNSSIEEVSLLTCTWEVTHNTTSYSIVRPRLSELQLSYPNSKLILGVH